jgi:polysaccharide biosynthesis/export protein
MQKSYKAVRLFMRAIQAVAMAIAMLGSSLTYAATDDIYLIQPGDVLTVAVWKEPDLQGEVLVRPDGGLSFPLVGNVMCNGQSIAELQQVLTERLVKYIPDPVVTIGVKAVSGSRIYVVGKVNRPGEFALSRPIDVMQALSLAGGATPFASLNDIRVLRRTGEHQIAIGFRYNDIEKGHALEQNILLKSGDTVVVP